MELVQEFLERLHEYYRIFRIIFMECVCVRVAYWGLYIGYYFRGNNTINVCRTAGDE